jgi:hypothetical protein
LTSAAATPPEFPLSTTYCVCEKDSVAVEKVIGKKTWLESLLTPGLETVIVAVPCDDTSAVEIEAASCEALKNVVARGLPFQFTIDPDTKPVPLTVRVKPELPGATVVGTSGSLMSGTGETWAQRTAVRTGAKRAAETETKERIEPPPRYGTTPFARSRQREVMNATAEDLGPRKTLA